MRFSIIVPVYKVEKYIRRCADSILAQSYNDFEVIFVIDGSPDNSLAVLNDYSSDSRIRIIEKENGGATSARKTGALNANGEYIVCVDGDDYVNEMLLEKLDEEISVNHADMVCFGYETDSDVTPRYNMLPKGNYSRVKDIQKKYLHDFQYKDNNSGCLFYSLWTKAVKRDIFTECQLKVDDRIKNGEDLLLIAWFLSKVNSISVMEFSGYVYCNNEQSTTSKRVPYDLINVTNVVKAIESIGIIPFENVYYYYFQAIFILTRDLATQSKVYSDFRSIVNDNLQIDKQYASYSCCELLPIGLKLRFCLVKYGLWRLLYLLAKKA